MSASQQQTQQHANRPPWFATTFSLALGSGLLWYAAFPPLNLWPMAWLAPLGLLVLIRSKSMPGRRPYRAIWLAGFVHWMLQVHFFRLPHWAGYIGWVVASCYLACYFPLLVGLSRLAVHRWRWPLPLAAPVVLVGLELVRGYFAGGFSMALLGHSQVAWTTLIQIADLSGAYGVSFLVMLVAAALAAALPLGKSDWNWRPVAPAVLLLAATLAYGFWRTGQQPSTDARQTALKVALIQENYLTIFDNNFDRLVKRSIDSFADYMENSLDACRENPDLDLVIWPESMFAAFHKNQNNKKVEYLDDVLSTDTASPSPAFEKEVEKQLGIKIDPVRFREGLREQEGKFLQLSQQTAHKLNQAAGTNAQIALLVGCETTRFDQRREDRYNSALLIDGEGKVADRYYKMHRVLFGEYIPFGDTFPWLYKLSPMGAGISAGIQPRAFAVRGHYLSPSICFESTVPHLIRRQLVRLRREGTPVDALVNVTNDGWFHGSSCLDLHLTCNVFRAVENRRPMLVAANGGLSASIDGNGKLLDVSPRKAGSRLIVSVARDRRSSLYQSIGDWPAWFCLGCCLVLAVLGLSDRYRHRRNPSTSRKQAAEKSAPEAS